MSTQIRLHLSYACPPSHADGATGGAAGGATDGHDGVNGGGVNAHGVSDGAVAGADGGGGKSGLEKVRAYLRLEDLILWMR